MTLHPFGCLTLIALASVALWVWVIYLLFGWAPAVAIGGAMILGIALMAITLRHPGSE